ncbi:uncharacterized protein F4812DRAFT_218248 [Daldinia caldariorum]|uniref:uncharacterized protein n=1 Tax=Daldinia caldariorum TaxID=326644 RepID=UPI002008DD73|nr:uncharacterized protein F4812DRAFT_218248 [Daldinia caldariorum]KAI1463975.1 hypothetical protein F4812DRAFT_218248 [Daldinia caldariorum]
MSRPLGDINVYERLKKELEEEQKHEKLSKSRKTCVNKCFCSCMAILIFLIFILLVNFSWSFQRPPVYDGNVDHCQHSLKTFSLLVNLDITGLECQATNLAPMLTKNNIEYTSSLPDVSVFNKIDKEIKRLQRYEDQSHTLARNITIRRCEIEYRLNWYLSIMSSSASWYMILQRRAAAVELEALALVTDNEASMTYQHYVEVEKDMAEMLEGLHQKQEEFCAIVSNIQGYMVYSRQLLKKTKSFEWASGFCSIAKVGLESWRTCKEMTQGKHNNAMDSLNCLGSLPHQSAAGYFRWSYEKFADNARVARARARARV